MPTGLPPLPSTTESQPSMLKKLIYIAIVLGFSAGVQAQDVRLTDVELWLKAGAKVDLTQKLRLSFEEQIRFDNDLADLKSYHSELDFRYELSDNFDLLAVGRFITRNDNEGANQGFEDRFRYQLGTSYAHRTGQWRFKHRLLYQNQNDLEITKGQGDVHEQFLRLRTNVGYKVKNWKYDPQFRVEYFSPLKTSDTESVNEVRIGFGTEREYKRLGEFGFFFLMDFYKEGSVSFVDQAFFLKYTYLF